LHREKKRGNDKTKKEEVQREEWKEGREKVANEKR